jgi:hypothetical protein
MPNKSPNYIIKIKYYRLMKTKRNFLIFYNKILLLYKVIKVERRIDKNLNLLLISKLKLFDRKYKIFLFI